MSEEEDVRAKFTDQLRLLKTAPGYQAFQHLANMQKTQILISFMFGDSLTGDELKDLQKQMQAWIRVFKNVDDSILAQDKFAEESLRQAEQQMEQVSDAQSYRESLRRNAESGDLVGGYANG